MTMRLMFVRAILAAAVVWAAVQAAQAETAKLELKRLGSPDKPVVGVAALYRQVQAQSFFQQISDAKEGVTVHNQYEEDFRRLVKKEPAKYNAKSPLRAVAELGGKKYAFVLDTKDEKSNVYCRLYFDLKHNGDLTEAKVIEGKAPAAESIGGPYSATYCPFPRIDITLDVDGVKMDYAFFFNAYSNNAGDFKYVSASLSAAAYREGDIVLEGKKRHVVLLDYNSNGRFDDETAVQEFPGSEGRIYPRNGDVLLVDPALNGFRGNPYDFNSGGCRHLVSKLTCIDGRYYRLKISAAGDKLTLTPSSVALGYATLPHRGFRATLFGEPGFVEIRCDPSKPAALPAGDWRLVSYTIDWTLPPEPPKKPGKKPAEKQEGTEAKPSGASFLAALFGALTPARYVGPRFTLVSAAGTGKCPVVKVRKGETVALPFGPPYKTAVTFGGVGKDKEKKEVARLQMSLLGAAGEECTNMLINGSRPSAPHFTITTKKDKVVAEGDFEYG